jgi:hypothetical protein
MGALTVSGSFLEGAELGRDLAKLGRISLAQARLERVRNVIPLNEHRWSSDGAETGRVHPSRG